MVQFVYYCYRCGTKNHIELPAPEAPEYHHADVKCSKCKDATRVLIATCPNPSCNRYVYWINDISIPELVTGFATYMVSNMQIMIDKAAQQGARIGIDTPETYPINATCPCGTAFAIEIKIPDLD